MLRGLDFADFQVARHPVDFFALYGFLERFFVQPRPTVLQ